MPDDKKKRGKPDRIRINVGQASEREYWCKALHTTSKELRAIVKKVGPMVADVKKYMIERIAKAGNEALEPDYGEDHLGEGRKR